jgi:hypothetical protein
LLLVMAQLLLLLLQLLSMTTSAVGLLLAVPWVDAPGTCLISNAWVLLLLHKPITRLLSGLALLGMLRQHRLRAHAWLLLLQLLLG